MSSLTVIRHALVTTVVDNTETELFPYAQVPDVAQLDACVARPRDCDFAKAFNRGLDEWEFDLFILVPRTDTGTSQEELDKFITGAGPDSVRQILFENPEIGLDDTDAFVKGVAGYGGEFETARVPHVGAILKVCVRTDGAQ